MKYDGINWMGWLITLTFPFNTNAVVRAYCP